MSGFPRWIRRDTASEHAFAHSCARLWAIVKTPSPSLPKAASDVNSAQADSVHRRVDGGGLPDATVRRLQVAWAGRRVSRGSGTGGEHPAA